MSAGLGSGAGTALKSGIWLGVTLETGKGVGIILSCGHEDRTMTLGYMRCCESENVRDEVNARKRRGLYARDRWCDAMFIT